MSRQTVLRWVRDAALFLALVAVVGIWQTRRHVQGGQAPAIATTTLGGSSVSLSALRGKPVLLAFWAPWCGVCKVESQNLGWVRKIVGSRAEVVSVAASFEDLSQVQRYVTEHGVDYPVWLGDDRLTAQYRVKAFPTVYFIAPDGTVKRSVVGYTTTLGLLARLML